MLEENLGRWLARLGSGEATPGGGAAAGLTGAQAAALLEMVCHLTPALREHAPRCAEHREAMAHLAQRDCDAFDVVSRAYRLPRGTPEDAARRTDAIQAGLRGALQVPLDTMEQVEVLLVDAAQVAAQANPNVASDAGIALVLAQATLEAALYNVRINARFLRDQTLAQEALGAAQARRARCEQEIAALRALIEPHMARR